MKRALFLILIAAGVGVPVTGHDCAAAYDDIYDAVRRARELAQPPAPLIEQQLRALITDFYAGRVTLEEYRAQKRALLHQPEPQGREVRLTALQALWERGYLTQEQYEQERAEVLGGP